MGWEWADHWWLWGKCLDWKGEGVESGVGKCWVGRVLVHAVGAGKALGGKCRLGTGTGSGKRLVGEEMGTEKGVRRSKTGGRLGWGGVIGRQFNGGFWSCDALLP